MAIELSPEDFEGLVSILARHGEWQSARTRIDFMGEAFATPARRDHMLGQIDLDGTPRNTSVRVLQRLRSFGQDVPGREALGVLVNRLIAYMGDGKDADRLRAMMERYPFDVPVVAARGVRG